MKPNATKTIIIVAAAMAVIGFLSLHTYIPRLGPVGNALNGKICLSTAEVKSSEDSVYSYEKCELGIPYKWVLTLAVLMAAYALISHRSH